MGEYLALRDEVRRVLAHLYAAVDTDGDEGTRLRRDADEMVRRALKLVRRAPLRASERREILDLVSGIERLRAVLPLAA